MDAFIPYMGKIVRLDVHHQQAFSIAGVVGNRVEAIKKRREKMLTELKKQEKESDLQRDSAKDEDENDHLDVWV
ncbi:hypothetical protein [Pseudoalteromonas xiamenensis]